MHKKYYTIIAISATILLSASFYYSKDSTPQEIKTIKKIQTEDNFQIKVINQNPTQNKMQEPQTNSIKKEKEVVSQNQEAKEKKHIRKLKKNTPIASTPLTQNRYSINIALKEELQKEEKTGVVNFIPLIFKINHENQSEELILTLEESYKNHIDNLEIKISDIVTKKRLIVKVTFCNL